MNQRPDFSFDADAPMVRLSDRDILDGLRRFARLHGPGSFTTTQFDAWRAKPFTSPTVARRFGSWRAALSRIGIQAARPRTYSPEELIANLERVWRSLGRRPGAKALARRGRISKDPYQRLWGSVERAGRLLAAHHRGEVTRDQLLRAGPAKPRRTTIPNALRWTILKRDQHRCAGCGQSPATHRGLSLEVDHIVPVCRGGGNEEGNLRTLCSACNNGKRDGE